MKSSWKKKSPEWQWGLPGSPAVPAHSWEGVLTKGLSAVVGISSPRLWPAPTSPQSFLVFVARHTCALQWVNWQGFFSVHLPDVAAFTMRTVMDVFGSAASTFISFLIETLGGLLGQWVTAGVTLYSWNSQGSFPCRTGVTVPPGAWPSPRALQLLYRGKISKRGKNLGRQTCKGISRLNRKCWRAEKSLGLVLGLLQIHWAGASRHVKVYMQKFTLILRK